jgi:S-(hydroxymethyl)glutathione dehydrogenase/alcohol dehydrogenase
MDVELDPPGAGEVRVRVEAAGVCHSDLHVRNLEWDVPLPLVMGHEGAGVVTEVGSGVTSLAEGDHVILCWQPACRRCRRCLAGRPAQCELVAEVVGPKGVLYDGTSRFRVGGQTAYRHRRVVVLRGDDRPRDRGGVIPGRPVRAGRADRCCVPTGVGSVLWTARMPPGATAVVIGCRAVGLCAVQGAVMAAASRIVAVDLLAHKAETARSFRATDVVDASAVDPVEAVREITGGGADHVFGASDSSDGRQAIGCSRSAAPP